MTTSSFSKTLAYKLAVFFDLPRDIKQRVKRGDEDAIAIIKQRVEEVQSKLRSLSQLLLKEEEQEECKNFDVNIALMEIAISIIQGIYQVLYGNRDPKQLLLRYREVIEGDTLEFARRLIDPYYEDLRLLVREVMRNDRPS